jgi:SlyX protein
MARPIFLSGDQTCSPVSTLAWQTDGATGFPVGLLSNPQTFKGIPMSALPDPRIVSLEIEVAHQGKAIEDLSSLVNDQYAEIERLKKRLDALASRFLALEETAAPAVEVAKPPHW